MAKDRELIEPMEFFKIDKVSDDVYALGPNVILKFNVSLSKISNGKRHHFHKEYEYSSRGIPEQPTLVTIKRSFDYYLSIENMQKDSNGNKAFIRIGPQEYMLFKRGLEEAISWFTDKKWSKLFAHNNGKLILVSPIPEFDIPNLPMQKYIHISPVIIDKGIANADKEPGVRFVLGDESNFVDMNLDRLMGLYYIISCFNMYQAALSIVNYVERPEFGTNRFIMKTEFSIPDKQEDIRQGVSGITSGRVVDCKRNISSLEG